MKCHVVVLACLIATVSVEAAVTNAVSFVKLRTSPEKFHGKAVTYTEQYNSFRTTLLPYMEDSGFKEDRYLILDIGDSRLPVIIRKREEVSVAIAKLKPGDQVMVQGRLRVFKGVPESDTPRYYVEATSVTAAAKDAGLDMAAPDKAPDKAAPKRQPDDGGLTKPPVERKVLPVSAEPPPF